MPVIYVDADACPVKEEIIRVGERFAVVAHFVTNRRLRLPQSDLIRQVVVGNGFDAADDWIAERAGCGDVVISADIMLAERCLKREALVLGPTGQPFTPDNIGTALAMRALNSDLRAMGEIAQGSPAFSRQDRARFLQMLDRMLRRLVRG